MNDKELLIKEIDKYYQNISNPFAYLRINFYSNTNTPSLIDLFEELKDNKKSKKVLINNTLGLLGNLLYKYKDNEEISDYIYAKEKEIVLEAIKQNPYVLRYVSKDKNIKDLCYEAVKQNGAALEYAPEELQNDKYLVLEAIKQNGYAFKYASTELQNDKKFVLNAVKIHGNALKYASEELKNDKEVVLEAIKKDEYAIVFANAQLRKEMLQK